MKKLLAVVLLLAVSAGTCFAEGGAKLIEGYLAYSNMSVEEYSDFVYEAHDKNVWEHYVNIDPMYSAYTKSQSDEVTAFDSITEMLIALDAGKIRIMELPEPVGKYLLRQPSSTNKYITCHYIKGVEYYLSMGFKEGSKWFEPFNAAIKAMNEDDTLLLLKAKYVDYAKDNPDPITFEKFPDAETVKIAVTGDMPPIDYVAADGSAAGFNTAMLAEIGRRLKVNIELLSVNAGARAAALASGRADGVFWFWYDKATKAPRDVPAGVSLTEPYYSYNTFMYIGKKLGK